MRRSTLVACVLLLVGISLQAQDTSPSPPSGGLKNVPSFDINAMDKSVDPCADFYQFACSNWLKNNPIPVDQAEWGRFDELHERNQMILRNILEKASADTPNRSSNDQKIGNYYYSCMDEAGIEANGAAPLKPLTERINAVYHKSQLPVLIGQLHSSGVEALFAFGSEPDAKDSVMEIAGTDQGGLGLPDRDYYLKTDARAFLILVYSVKGEKSANNPGWQRRIPMICGGNCCKLTTVGRAVCGN